MFVFFSINAVIISIYLFIFVVVVAVVAHFNVVVFWRGGIAAVVN